MVVSRHLARKMELELHEDLARLLTIGDDPDGMQKNDKRNRRRKVHQFMVRNDTLFYVSGKSHPQVVVEDEKR